MVGQQRDQGDAWYTVLYKYPHTLWWAPALVSACFLVAIVQLLTPQPWPVALGGAASVGAFSAAVDYRRWRRRAISGSASER